ncbi:MULTISPECIES: IS3 family transposase [Lactococcus]|uniref:IS3 family transposase n=1 Tax=Lactococcus TaxID=1357 RepID=UPI0023018292|nr:IS3 family transposase [Lactococcus sp. UBA7220]
MDELRDKYGVSFLCSYFQLSRSGFYAWVNKGKPLYKAFKEDIAQLIQEIFEVHEKGYRYITMQLKRLYGVVLNPKTVLRYMQILGLKSPIRKKRFTSCTKRERNEKARVVMPNALAQNFVATRPNQKLVTDVSYIYHKSGRCFLSVIKDLYDNSILAYRISPFNDNRLVFDNLDLVFNAQWDTDLPCTLHSDQGFQYTNRTYIKKLYRHNVITSHSRKGNCYDNAPCENFFSHLKSESLELHVPENEQALRQQVDDFIFWYNYDRPQEKLKGMTPMEYRSAYLIEHHN